MSIKYSYDDMEKLSQQIQKIKNKQALENIRDIIIDNNKNINITENSRGIYLCFNQLSNETYIKLDKYIKKYFDNLKEDNDTSEYPSIITSHDGSNYDNNSKLKFSNKEKNLIKKRLYDKALQKNSELNNYEKNNTSQTTNTIFIKKNKKIDN